MDGQRSTCRSAISHWNQYLFAMSILFPAVVPSIVIRNFIILNRKILAPWIWNITPMKCLFFVDCKILAPWIYKLFSTLDRGRLALRI